MSGKIRIICGILAFALVALLSSFVGYRVMTVVSLVLGAVVLDNVCMSLYNRLIGKTLEATWAYWVTIATAVVGTFFLIWQSNTGWNPIMWFTVLCFVCAVIFGVVDAKVLRKSEEEEESAE